MFLVQPLLVFELEEGASFMAHPLNWHPLFQGLGSGGSAKK